MENLRQQNQGSSSYGTPSGCITRQSGYNGDKHGPSDFQFPAFINPPAVPGWLHFNRTPRGDCRHCDSGGPVIAGVGPGETQSAGNSVHVQSSAIVPGLADVLG